jgi:hypothetical protein
MKSLINTSFMSGCIIFCVASGCSSDRSKRDAEIRGQNALVAEADAQLAPYMTGDVDEARQSLKNSVRHLKASDMLNSHTQASLLYTDYIRLFVLESRSGHPAAAKDALMLGQYWRLRSLELPSATNDDDIIYFMSEPPTNFFRYVDNLDGDGTGRKPAYLKSLTNSPGPTAVDADSSASRRTP